MSTYLFEDESGVVRLEGTLSVKQGEGATNDVPTQQADGKLAQGQGGGGNPVWAQYTGSTITVADGASGQLTFDFLVGTELLDRTDPANPTFLADGFYFVSAFVACATGFTAGGGAVCFVSDGTAACEGTTIIVNGGAGSNQTQMCSFAPESAGATLTVVVVNQDGGGVARDFSLTGANICKLA